MSQGRIVAAGFSVRKVAMKDQNTRNLKVAATKKTDEALKVISMQPSIIKSLLTSLCQREVNSPSLIKRGKGRFFNNDVLLILLCNSGKLKCQKNL